MNNLECRKLIADVERVVDEMTDSEAKYVMYHADIGHKTMGAAKIRQFIKLGAATAIAVVHNKELESKESLSWYNKFDLTDLVIISVGLTGGIIGYLLGSL